MAPEQAVILCGGLGSRLGELTRQTPKPLLPIQGRPFLEILIQEISRYGVTRFLLLAAFRSELIETFAREVGARLGRDITVEVSIEPDRAGTGGALVHALPLLDETFYLFNGDSLLDTPLDRLAGLLSRPGAGAALALRRLEAGGRYGVVERDGERIISFGKKGDPEAPAWINGGVYALRRALIARLPSTSSIEDELFAPLAEEGGGIYGLETDGFFLDIGVPEDFARAQTAIPAHQHRPAVFFDRDGVLNLDHGHVGTPDRFEWVEGAREAVAAVNARGWYAFIVTNQAGIGKGFYSIDDHHRLMRHMRDELAAVGGHIDDQRFCPFHPEAAIEAYRQVSDWRKPGPGMLLDLMAHWPVDRANSLMIGDNQTDIQAAEAAGVAGYLFTRGRLDQFLDAIFERQNRP